MPKLSVILPVKNLSKYIERCLRSILKQTFTDYELIVVFDDCTDNSRQIAERIVGGTPHTFIDVSRSRAGLARNDGLALAEGEYVWFVDGDDYFIRDDAFRIAVDRLTETGASAAYMNNIEGTHSTRPVVWRLVLSRKLIGDTRFTDMISGQCYPFYDEISAKSEYVPCDIEETLYHYSIERQDSLSKVTHLVNAILLKTDYNWKVKSKILGDQLLCISD